MQYAQVVQKLYILISYRSDKLTIFMYSGFGSLMLGVSVNTIQNLQTTMEWNAILQDNEDMLDL